MPRELRISGCQLTMIWIGFLIGSSTLVIPCAGVGVDAWISTFLGGAIGLLDALLLIKLSTRFPEKLPAEIFRECAGKLAGTLFAVIYVWYCFHLGSLAINNGIEGQFAASFKRTPEGVVNAIMAFLIIVAVYLGIEVMARTTEVLSPVLVFNIVMVSGLAAMTKGLLRPGALLPILEKGWIPVLKGAWASFSFPFGETAVLLSVLPYVGQEKRTTFSVLGGTAIVAVLLTTVAMRNTMALGGSITSLIFPSMTTVSLISVGVLIQRLDDLLLFIWTFGIFIKAALCLFAVTVNLKVLLGVKNYRILAFPCGALMSTLASYVYRNSADMTDFASFTWPLYSVPFEVIIPLFILALAMLRKRGKLEKRTQ